MSGARGEYGGQVGQELTLGLKLDSISNNEDGLFKPIPTLLPLMVLFPELKSWAFISKKQSKDKDSRNSFFIAGFSLSV